MRRWSLAPFFCILYMYVGLSRELGENPKHLQKMLIHLWSSSSLLDVPFLTPLPRVLGLTCQTPYSGVSLLTDQHPSSFLPVSLVHVGTALRQRGPFWHSGTASEILKIIPLATHNTQRPTHIHPPVYIYIYIYIYTHTYIWMPIIVPQYCYCSSRLMSLKKLD